MAAGISVTISASDAASGVINKVNTGLENLARKTAAARVPTDRMAASFSRLGQITGLDRLSSDMGGLGRQIGAAGVSLGKFAPALGALTGVASVAGIASLVNRWTDFGSRLGLDSQRIGITADKLQGLQGAARLAGSSAEALTSGMTSLQDELTNAAAGRAPQMVSILSQLGISFRDASGHARKAADVLPELANKISSIRDPSQRAMVATMAFGSAGENLLPFLTRGAAGIREYNAMAETYGVLTRRGVEAARAMQEEQTRLALSIEGVGNAVSAEVAPVLVPMLQQLSNWVRDNRGEIAGFFHTVAQAMKDWVDGGGLALLIERLKLVYRALSDIVGIADSVGHGLRKAWDSGEGKRFIDEYGNPIGPAGTPIPGVPPATVPTLPGQGNHLPGGWIERNMPTWLGGRAAPSTAITPGSTALPSGPTVSDGFVQRYGAFAQRVAQETGVSARVVLGHLLQETGGRGDQGNNPFNMQAGPAWTGATIERGDTHADGSRYTTKFRSYPNLAEAADDYISLLKRRYPDALNAGNDALKFGRGLENGANGYRYAEDPRYAEHVASATGRLPVAPPAAPVPRPPMYGTSATQLPVLAPPVPPVPAGAPLGSQGQPGPDGKATVRLTFDNPPPNMRATTVAQGGLRVETPTLGAVP